MTKQEEIQEGIEEILKDTGHFFPYVSAAEEILTYLKLEGVVIKVECPKCRGHARPNKITYNLHTGYTVDGHSCPNCQNTGYTAWEDLV